MNSQSRCFILLFAIALLCACESQEAKKAMSYPSGPQEEVYSYDTVDCSKMNIPAAIMAKAITVREAIRIGKTIPSGQATQEKYYIKGLVKGFNEKKHVDGITNFGNACFYIQDSKTSTLEFYGYQVYGLNGEKFTSLEQMQIGDFVIIYGTIYNYSGTIETESKGAAHLAFSTNELLYPETDVAYFKEDFKDGLGSCTQRVVTDPQVTVWKQSTTSQGATSAIAQAIDEQKVNHPGEVWLVTPPVDLQKEQPKSAVKLTFQTYYQNGTTQLKTMPDINDYLSLKVSTDGTNWDDMTIPNFNNGKLPSYVNDTIDISAYVSASTQVAFVYKSDATYAPKWSVSTISIVERKRGQAQK